MGHGNYAPVVVLIAAHQFTINFIPRTPVPDPIGAPTLNHEVGDNPVKDQPVIKIVFRKVNKILYRVGSVLIKKLDFDYAFFCMDFGCLHFDLYFGHKVRHSL